jgi:hypothetical protein
MNHKKYISAKKALKEVKNDLKGYEDKPYIRQCLNDTCDSLEMDIRNDYSISEAMQELYCKWLQNYCCKLHP